MNSKALALGVFLLLTWLVSVDAAERQSPQRPNVLVVIWDGQGYGELSCQENPVLRTPNLDQLQNDYFDDTCIHDGRRQTYTGDTTDVFFREAMTWMNGEADAGRPSQTKPPMKLILDTDMSGDADDAGTLAMLHALVDRGECELLATIVNRADLTKASAAAVDAINTYYGRPDIPIGTDKVGPTALQRTSLYAPGLRDGFPNDIGPDDQAPDAFDVYRRVLTQQPDDSVTVCSVGALSNLAELWRREPALVHAKIRRVVVMGGQFPAAAKPETNIATHPEAARLFADQWPTEIVWQGFEVGRPVITGEALKQTTASNPVRRAYELRRFAGRPSINGGQPSYDQAAAFYAVRGANAELWSERRGGRVVIDERGFSRWVSDATSPHVMVNRVCVPELLARQIEALMVAPPQNPAIKDSQ